MSIRSGISEIRRDLEQLRGGIGGVIGLAERMRRIKALGVSKRERSIEELQQQVADAKPNSLCHTLASHALKRAIEQQEKQ
jgi:hypothetical protein